MSARREILRNRRRLIVILLFFTAAGRPTFRLCIDGQRGPLSSTVATVLTKNMTKISLRKSIDLIELIMTLLLLSFFSR